MKFDSKMKVLLGAVVAVSSAATSAGVYYAELTGAAFQNTSIIDLSAAGLPVATETPAVQAPSTLLAAGGTGWPGRLSIAIDEATGQVVDFEIEFLEDSLFGASAQGPQYDVRGAGRKLVPNNGSFADFSFDASCVVGNAALIDGNTIAPLLASAAPIEQRPDVPASDATTHVVHCPGVAATVDASTGNVTAPGSRYMAVNASDEYLCATDLPVSTTPGENGCENPWAGDLFDTSNAQIANAPYVCNTTLAANPFNTAGSGAGLGPSGADLMCTADPGQNLRALVVHEFQSNHGGGTWVIEHTGSLAGGDFNITSVSATFDVNVSFPIANLPAGTPVIIGNAQSFQTWVFDTVEERAFPLGAGKNVPAMGAFGLAALFGGLVVVAARLRRRVS